MQVVCSRKCQENQGQTTLMVTFWLTPKSSFARGNKSMGILGWDAAQIIPSPEFVGCQISIT